MKTKTLRAAMVLGWLLVAVQHGAVAARPEACVLGCQQQQAECERREGPRADCAVRGLRCEQQCRPAPAATPKTVGERQLLCEQRCDLNRSTCEAANANDGAFCAAGQKTCRERCR